jgi:carboxypeptidase C (cathepsin A)
MGEYNTALMKGSHLSAAERTVIDKKIAHFTGLSEEYVLRANLRVNGGQFSAEILRSRGLALGGFDERYTGYNTNLLSETAQASTDLPEAAFSAMFNTYVRNELKFGQDKVYHVWARDGGGWDLKHNGSENPDVGLDLAKAIVSNPHLRVEVENGFFDLDTLFFQTEYEMSHLHLPDQLQGNVQLQFYYGGHMMYMNPDAAMKLKNHVGKFVEEASHN